jgi:hypothetical protein
MFLPRRQSLVPSIYYSLVGAGFIHGFPAKDTDSGRSMPGFAISPIHPNLTSPRGKVQLPDKGILSRTLFNNDRIKAVFCFAQGKELSEHTGSMLAVLHLFESEATLTLANDKVEAKPGTWVHIPKGLRYSF